MQGKLVNVHSIMPLLEIYQIVAQTLGFKGRTDSDEAFFEFCSRRDDIVYENVVKFNEFENI